MYTNKSATLYKSPPIEERDPMPHIHSAIFQTPSHSAPKTEEIAFETSGSRFLRFPAGFPKILSY